MTKKNALLYAVFQNPKCVKEFRLLFIINIPCLLAGEDLKPKQVPKKCLYP